MVVIIVLALLMSAVGCGASDAAGGYYPAFDSMPASSSAPVVDDGLKDNDSKEPVFDEEPAEEAVQEPDSQDAVDTTPATEEPDAMPVAEEPDNRTDDEKLVDEIVDICSVQAPVETDLSTCVVDVRTALNPYDVAWDYGGAYSTMSFYENPAWDYVFDIEYYKDTFPMLAMLYHDEELFLRLHFTTVGIHEGRQGSMDFNVQAFMEVCPDWIREKFGDNYACYYLYYIHSEEVDRTVDVSGKGYPKQMSAIMTAVQKEEFDKINAERERLGIDPLVFDSELAAVANYRGWINAYEDWAAHDWAIRNNDKLWDIVAVLDGDTIGENTTSRFRRVYGDWYSGYARSESHYNAMTNAAYGFVGNSNIYACDNDLEQYSNWKSDTRMIHFDIFMGTLDTALNSK